jgi:hypothetical protein
MLYSLRSVIRDLLSKTTGKANGTIAKFNYYWLLVLYYPV